jgi:hypothetical protein
VVCGRNALVISGTSLTFTATAQGADTFAPTAVIGSPAASPGDDDPTVKAWKEQITKTAKAAGGDAPVFTSAEYVIDPERPRGKEGDVTTQVTTAYPVSGCTLQMVTYHDKSTVPSYVKASSLTSCLSNAGTIYHYVSLRRFDFLGWNRRAWDDDYAYNTRSFALTIRNRCSDANYNAWSGYVSGEMWKGGYYYKASAVHEVGLYCGGS